MRKTLIRLTESDLHRIVKETVNKILNEGFGKGKKYGYKTKDGEMAECQFVTSTFEDGYPYSVGLIDHYKKQVSPCHGYYYPNRCAKGLMKLALKLGYTYVDDEMPAAENKTLRVKNMKESVLRESNDPIGQFADICCKDEEILRCKTAEEVFNTINGHLQKTYKGRATERKIASVAKDVTVSVCLKLHIPGI